MRYLDGPRPRFFAHRGGGLEGPENTLEAFAAGLAAGADRLELDVHATSDGEIVVLHRRLARSAPPTALAWSACIRSRASSSSTRGFTSPATRATFRCAVVACGIPTLAELLETFPGVPLNIEIKQLDPPIEDRVLAVLDRFRAREQVLLAAEDAYHGADPRRCSRRVDQLLRARCG